MASLFQPASAVERRLKVLAYGPPGVGKTHFALSFQTAGKMAVIDTEGGTALYGGKFQFDVLRTKDFVQVMAAIEEMKRDGGKTYQTLVIDPITALWETLQGAGQKLAETRSKNAANAGGIVDAVLTQRDWGIIKRQYARLMNELVNLPMHVVITAWQKELTDKDGNKTGGVGIDSEKRTGYSPDIVLRFTGGPQYTAIVEKDRSGLYPLGTKLNGPTYASFAKAVSHGAAITVPDDETADASTAAMLAPEMLPSAPTPAKDAQPQHPAQPQPAPARPSTANAQTGADAMVTDRQIVAINKLCMALKITPPNFDKMTFEAAKAKLTELTQAYSEARQAS